MMRLSTSFIVSVCVCMSTGALAQQAGLDNNSGGERPWASGVSAANQKSALELFRQGNVALKDPNFVLAAQKYREALLLWDHPAIHYNLALALLQLDQPVETYEHVVAALKYGKAPLDADKFDQANRYKTLLEGQLATVQITCNTDKATVKMDGRVLFISPGKWVGQVRAGPHTIVASKDGYVTTEQTQVMPAGQSSSFHLKLFTTDDLTEYRRHFNVAIPWVVLGAGVAIVGTSVALHLTAGGAMREYDRQIADCRQATTGGCIPSPATAGVLTGARTMQSFAIAGYIVGGVAIGVGSYLLYYNRLQAFRVNVGIAGLVVPVITPSSVGAAAMFTF